MGWVLQTTNNWNTVLIAGIVSTFIAAYLWTRVNPRVEPPVPNLITVRPGVAD
jgi:hypothetical protein